MGGAPGDVGMSTTVVTGGGGDVGGTSASAGEGGGWVGGAGDSTGDGGGGAGEGAGGLCTTGKPASVPKACRQLMKPLK